MAITFEGREVGIARAFQIHRHAVDDRLEMLLRKLERRDRGREGERHRVLRSPFERRADLGAPPAKLDPRHPRVADFVDDVIDLAAECIQRRNGAPLIGRQETEAVVEARPALRRLLRAVFVGTHRTSAVAVIASQSRPRSRGR